MRPWHLLSRSRDWFRRRLDPDVPPPAQAGLPWTPGQIKSDRARRRSRRDQS